MIKELDKAKKEVETIEADATLSKKEKKNKLEDPLNIVEDRTELLSKSYIVLMRNIDGIKASF